MPQYHSTAYPTDGAGQYYAAQSAHPPEATPQQSPTVVILNGHTAEEGPPAYLALAAAERLLCSGIPVVWCACAWQQPLAAALLGLLSLV